MHCFQMVSGNVEQISKLTKDTEQPLGLLD
jgi:hypothetical protein